MRDFEKKYVYRVIVGLVCGVAFFAYYIYSEPEDFEDTRYFAFLILVLFVGILLRVGRLFAKRIDDVGRFKLPILASSKTLFENCAALGVNAVYVGNSKDLRKWPRWHWLSKEYPIIRSNGMYHEPNPTPHLLNPKAYFVKRNNAPRYSFIPRGDNIIFVEFDDGTVQGSILHPMENELFEARDGLESYRQEGVPIDGNYRLIENAENQFKTSWLRMIVIIAVGTAVVVTALVLLGIS